MSTDIDTANVRVLFTRPGYLVLGPLGCYYVGQRLSLVGGEMEITSIDPDGAGIARTDEQIAAFPHGPAFKSFPCRGLAEVGPPPVMERVAAGMAAQCEYNRRVHGVVLPEPVSVR